MEILAFSEQSSIVCFIVLQLKYLFFFINCDVSLFKFQDIRIIIPQNILDRDEKKMLLLDTVNTQKKLVISFKELLAVIYILIKDLAFFWSN